MLDEIFSQRDGRYGLPKVQWASNYKLWDLYKSNPEYFTVDRNQDYRNAVGRSKRASEVIASAYLRGDVALFEGRLKLVGGVRAEQTNVYAEGFLSDATRNYRRDASGNVVAQRDAGGNVILGTNGLPLPALIEPTTINGVSNALAISRLTYIDRGQHTRKEYLRLFPNLNASYNLRENLIARAAYFNSVGRPAFSQYAGGVTLPDTERLPDPNTNVISVNNAGIKAWTATTTKVRLEYYFERVGQISAGAFRRDYRNLFGSITFPATADFLALYSLDAATYERFAVATNYNIPGLVRMEGYEFDYKQALTFLPRWARGVQAFGNATVIRSTEDRSGSFANYFPRTYNWGVSVTRPKFALRMNWNYMGRRRGNLVAESARSIEPGTFSWNQKRLYIDVSGEYNLSKRIALFASIKNLNSTTEDSELRGPNTPEHAQLTSRSAFGALWVFGLKGTY